MVCTFEMKNDLMIVNCSNCLFGSSLEDFDVCFAKTIDKIIETKKVGGIVLSGVREYEYDYEQTKMLIEIAEVYDKLVNRDNVLNYSRLGNQKCDTCFPKRSSEVKFIVQEMIRRDPIGAYVKINRLIKSCLKRAGKESPKCRKCYRFYVDKVLMPIKKALEETTLIKLAEDKLHKYRPGDRLLYRKVFHPLIRPQFMLTRYRPIPPKGGIPVERYDVSGITIEVFKVPGQVRYYYHVTPPEFKLSDEEYTVLDDARKYLAEHRPTEREFSEPEKTREVFMNMGKDVVRRLVRSRGLKLKTGEIDEMANILGRYTAGFGILEVLLKDSKIQDIYINSPIGTMPIFVGHGEFEECETNLIPTREDAEGWATRFRLLSGRPLDEANPVLDTELNVPGGRARVCVITRTLSPEGIGYALRRHRERPWTYPLFMNVKYFDSLFAGLMSFLVDGSRALLIAGGRSSGKTSLLAATMLEIMRKFRIVTQEDTLELPVIQLRKLGYNIERLKSRSVITRVETELAAEEALRTALRLGDTCLIVGEVRSEEAKALYEAMRIGALANVVAGTIHGESAYGVFDRVVNDLGVPPTSFKATDVIVVCGMIRSADGLRKSRRVIEVTEVKKHWKEDPVEESGFANLMEYSAKEDKLKPTGTLLNGESYIINEIAKRVREWHGDWNAVWSNIELRGKIKQTIVDYANKLKRPEILEAEISSRSNEMFHLMADDVRKEIGSLDSKMIYDKWLEWFKKELK